jgi:hypothetical protein
MAREHPCTPSMSLPEGTEVKTMLGTFKVKKDSPIDTLIKPQREEKQSK